MRFDVRTDITKAKRELGRLAENIRERAIARALNRTAEQGRTAMVRGITEEFAIKAGEVRAQVKINKAREGAHGRLLTAELEAFGRRRGKRSRNVIAFGAREVKGGRRRAGGVSVRIKKAGGRKIIAGAFIGNQGRTVFERVPGTTMAARTRYAGTKHAEQIRPVETIDVPQMFNTRRINQRVVRLMRERFPEILDRETRYYVERFNR